MWVGNHAFDYKRWNVNCIQSGEAWLIYIASHPGMLLMKWQHMELSADRDDKLHFQKQHGLPLWALINKPKGLKWRGNKLEKKQQRGLGRLKARRLLWMWLKTWRKAGQHLCVASGGSLCAVGILFLYAELFKALKSLVKSVRDSKGKNKKIYM